MRRTPREDISMISERMSAYSTMYRRRWYQNNCSEQLGNILISMDVAYEEDSGGKIFKVYDVDMIRALDILKIIIEEEGQ